MSSTAKTSNLQQLASSEQDGLVHGLTAAEVQLLSAKSSEAKAQAYCPYSLFRVGASLLLHPTPTSTSPTIITGANVENASYPVGTCAERVALGTAVHLGHRSGSFKALGVATDMDDFCSPCGMCRQFLREFLELDTPVFMFDKTGRYKVLTMGELLPMSFGPDVLPSRESLRGVAEGTRGEVFKGVE
ncbi:cytidine deaminase [Delitschia confertaspora ATCC 74209]|uniref:Cytidine deaminase n=1 Tax=Delitschia confertaspora ATCC 74209 TaxID=1513339 RepID=A0A9P4JLF0_9PLEO|nr:cytidine deaminase [Delitschia confertaspora ATCC 74209]